MLSPFNFKEKLKYKRIKKIGRTHFLITSEYVGDVPITDRLMEIMLKDYERLIESPEEIEKFHSDTTENSTGFIAEIVI